MPKKAVDKNHDKYSVSAEKYLFLKLFTVLIIHLIIPTMANGMEIIYTFPNSEIEL
jgi:hypothetical protein